jgi:hypothetical protein
MNQPGLTPLYQIDARDILPVTPYRLFPERVKYTPGGSTRDPVYTLIGECLR